MIIPICRKILIFGFILFFSVSFNIFAQKNSFTNSQLAGTYLYSGSYSSTSITLQNDGEYYIEGASDACGVNEKNETDCRIYREWGSYEIRPNVLNFKMSRNWSAYQKSPPMAFSELIPVKWSDRIYIMEKRFLLNFVNAVNMGYEPRKNTSGNCPVFNCSNFYLRPDDEKKNVAGLPDLPKDWKSFLLKSPVLAAITKIENLNGILTATLNKGKSDGLKIGMILGSSCFAYNEILSVNKHSALMKINTGEKVGRIFSTKTGGLSNCLLPP